MTTDGTPVRSASRTLSGEAKRGSPRHRTPWASLTPWATVPSRTTARPPLVPALRRPGGPDGQLCLALPYAKGAGVERDDAQFVKWLRAAGEQGGGIAQALLGDLYATGSGGVRRDPGQADAWDRLLPGLQVHGRLQPLEAGLLVVHPPRLTATRPWRTTSTALPRA